MKLSYNSNDIVKTINDLLVDKMEDCNVDYQKRDEMLESIIPVLKQSYILVGTISFSNIKEIKSTYKNNNIIDVEIIYEDNSTVKLNAIG